MKQCFNVGGIVESILRHAQLTGTKVAKYLTALTSSTASAINGRRDEVQNPEIPEQRKVGMRAIIEGLKNSIRQTFQTVSQGNNSENIENSIKILS